MGPVRASRTFTLLLRGSSSDESDSGGGDESDSASFSFIFNLTPLIVTATTFAVYVWTGHTLTPAVAFTALTLFNLVRVPFIQLPLVLNAAIDVLVVNKRCV